MSSTEARLREYLLERGLTFTDEWLTACIDWAKEAYASNEAISDEFLRSAIYEQWLDADLQDMDSSCLPRSLGQERFKVLTGQFGLQINSIRDIGESAYNQYNKIKKLENENTNVSAGADNTEFKFSWQPKTRRCLYLTLTDGSQEIFGMEIVQIPSLSLDLKPGTKIVVSGPIDCRRGVLHLKPNHIKILGGAVESLIIKNSVENVLSRALNEPKSPETEPDSGISQSSRYTQSSLHNRTTQPIPPQNLSQASTQPISRTLIAQSINNVSMDDFGDDDIFMEIDEAALLQSAYSPPMVPALANPESSRVAPAANPESNRIAPGANHGSARFAPAASTVKNSAPSKTGKTKKFVAPPSNQGKSKASGSGNGKADPSTQKNIMSYLKPIPPKIAPSTAPRPPVSTTNEDEDIDIVDLEDEDSMSDSAMSGVPTKNKGTVSSRMDFSDFDEKAIAITKSPYQYIRQINSGLFKVGDTISVRGIIATLTSNISVDKSNGEWKLSVNVNDGSGYLVAKISTQILQRIIGFSPAQMKQMKAAKSAEGKANVLRGMNNLTSTLVHFNGLVGIRITDQPEQFIVSLSEISNQDVCALVIRTDLDPKKQAL